MLMRLFLKVKTILSESIQISTFSFQFKLLSVEQKTQKDILLDSMVL